MSDIAISVEHLGKQYRIGKRERYRALRDVITDGVVAPFRRLSSLGRHSSNGHSYGADAPDTFWALKDVSFEVKRAEVLGIIGRNGAGKSTLLKILSRITEPTEGRVRVFGRVGSLLEVGTGFHPELTGRENIFLNGAILGMKRADIIRQFDEIVAFAEVEKFIDTPVKHYSSGMYVRLAFAVAAHMEPEILIVDEVLAVGDAAFQKKCLGKMGDVANEGRTVLFVSHNMAAIRSLCGRGLFMEKGSVSIHSNIDMVIASYLNEGSAVGALMTWQEDSAPQSSLIRFRKAYILDEKNTVSYRLDAQCPFTIAVEYEILQIAFGLRIGFAMRNASGVIITGSTDWETSEQTRKPGYYSSQCQFPSDTLNSGIYSLFFGADVAPYNTLDVVTPYCVSFEIEDTIGHGPHHQPVPGVIKPKLNWYVLPGES